MLLIDLEDAVAPSDKDRARDAAIEYFSQPRSAPKARAFRINGLNSRAGLADISALLDSPAAPNFLILPKTESAAHLTILDRLLNTAGKAARLVALVESARGLLAVDEIASSTHRLAAVMLGAADMAADIGAEAAWEPLLYSRSLIVAACARHNLLAVDAPFFDIRDYEGVGRETAHTRALGFGAKAAIHPGQVAPINSALTPSADAISEARAILVENAKGVGVINGHMIDEAVARKARHTLAAAGLSV